MDLSILLDLGWEFIMKITKAVALIAALLLTFSLVSCSELHFHYGDSENQADGQDGASPSDGAGEGDGNNEDEQGNKTLCVYSLMSKKLHLPGCYHTNRITDDMRREHEVDILAMLEKGYELCQDCFPSEDSDDDEEGGSNQVSRDEATFVINASSLKFHKVGCYQTKGMTAENTVYTLLSFDELVAQEYIPCGSCLKQDETEEDDGKNGDEESPDEEDTSEK